jgi:rhodanese-related sulfurtransferase
MTPSQLLSAIDAGTPPRIVDVRSQREFANGHVPGAINVPLPGLVLSPSNMPGSRDDVVVLYCGHGPRAHIAAAVMRRAGFHRVSFLRGHMAGWRKSGFREER